MELGVTGIRRHCHLEGDAEVQGWLAALEGGRGAEKPGRALGKAADDLGHRVGSEHALAMAIRTSHLFIPQGSWLSYPPLGWELSRLLPCWD